MAITIIHAIHHNILPMIFFDVKAPVSTVLQVSPLLPAAFTTKILAPPSPEQMDSFYCLQCHLH